MCQHFSGQTVKQLFAVIHSSQATDNRWRNEVARGCKTLDIFKHHLFSLRLGLTYLVSARFLGCERSFPKLHNPSNCPYGSCSAGCHAALTALDDFPTHISCRDRYVTSAPSLAFASKGPSIGVIHPLSPPMLCHGPAHHLPGKEINHYGQIQSAFLRCMLFCWIVPGSAKEAKINHQLALLVDDQ
ncbi:hypothetical protein Metal_3388 [Methylomicrobium album BG8]|uniref:Uncharacterized protein n=1 Tax=Methylomicrobium album BG8 TaxID=686340 RepID=H8GQR2_METAL|nr:hypothetical protein Metal_3388 [Methylomicrobium album BG8]